MKIEIVIKSSIKKNTKQKLAVSGKGTKKTSKNGGGASIGLSGVKELVPEQFNHPSWATVLLPNV